MHVLKSSPFADAEVYADSSFYDAEVYADSSFYDDPEHKYPTIEEQIKMARKVARSLEDANNRAARGHNMYMKRKQKSAKWTAGYDVDMSDVNQLG